MAPRASWKGFLKIGELSCPVALYTAVSTSERIVFHTLNRETGNRVHRQFVDQETGALVESGDQVKGYETGKGHYVVLEPTEIAAAFPDSDKTLDVLRFVSCDEIDDVYFDRPYYLGPSEAVAEKAFTVIREGMRAGHVAALGRAVLFRRIRTVLIQAHDKGMIATLLHFDYEVRSAKEAFSDVPVKKVGGEMLDLARHIIRTKRGKFEPAAFDDRYEAALADLVKAKLAGKKIEARKAPQATNVVDLMEALRRSASSQTKAPSRKAATKPTAKSATKSTAKSAPKSPAKAQKRAGASHTSKSVAQSPSTRRKAS